MAYEFTGKRALVTGAGAGIGKGIALQLAELGAEVIALSKTQEHLDKLKNESPSIYTVCVDLSDWNATENAVNEILPVQLLVNNAAAIRVEPFLESSKEAIDTIYDVNLKAVINISQIVGKDLVRRGLNGSFVNISSVGGHRAADNLSIYCSSKAALNGLTRCMALELAPKGIRVNAVSPVVVATDMGRLAWSDEEKLKRKLARIPQGRLAEVGDVVNATMFLLSDSSDMVNGHMLPVDGGNLTN